MSTASTTFANITGHESSEPPIIAIDLPVMYEDEGQDELGETDTHYDAMAIFRFGVQAHLAKTKARVFSDLNVYYHPLDPNAYVSPDGMVVYPRRDLGEHVTSYFTGRDGPNPVLTAEVLSKRSVQQQDLGNKLTIYSMMEVPEYMLIDATGQFLDERLLLKELTADGQWVDRRDADGSITSRLGFRLRVDDDDRLRVVDGNTGTAYARPDEAETEREAREQFEAKLAETQRLLAAETAAREQEAAARRGAEERFRAAQAELERLRREADGGER